jgi:hypothetical protein
MARPLASGRLLVAGRHADARQSPWIAVKTERFPGPHPLCRCPETTFSGGPTAAQTEECRRASSGITHPIVTLEDIQSLMKGNG